MACLSIQRKLVHKRTSYRLHFARKMYLLHINLHARVYVCVFGNDCQQPSQTVCFCYLFLFCCCFGGRGVHVNAHFILGNVFPFLSDF